MSYVPLYIKTDNSLQQSLIKIDDLINKAKEYGLKALTITDNNMYGVMDFYHACLKNDIKPIIGLEITCEKNTLVLYCMNYQGYQNLIKLCTIMSSRELTLTDLETYAENILCLLPYGSSSLLDSVKKIYKYVFRTYQNADEKKELSSDALFMRETLYLNKEDSRYYKYLKAVKDGVSVDSVSTDKLNNYLLSYDEVHALDDLKNNERIAELCSLEIPFHQKLMPVFKNDEGLDSYTFLKRKCIEGLKKKFGERVSSVYQNRLKYELDVINKMGFCDYFLIVYDYIKYSKEHNIIVGPGRGSAVGSLVAYCLDITEIDPIKYDLLFERFLNVERVSMPDIDIDFEHLRREEVINYCMEKYGLKSVAPIISFGTLGSKQAVRDVGRCMDIAPNIVDGLCKILDSRLSLKENQQNPKVQKYLERYDNLEVLYKIAMRFEGLKRHTSIHASGVVMSECALDDVIPLDQGHNSFYTSGYDMTYLEEIGLLKMDFLAIKYLTIIHEIIDDVNRTCQASLTFDNIPFNDQTAMKIMEDGNTLGIFQFESEGMINFLKQLKITSFDDICAAIALYRPGPMNNIPLYIKRKNSEEKIDYLDDSLKPILKSTYGIMIYQEQIMQIANVMADYSLGEADILRKAMSKKKKDLLLQEEKRFKERSLKKGYAKDTVDKVYAMMLKFAEYGFNKSHSVGYSLVAYRMAYLKAHYPEIFISNLLSTEMNDDSKCKRYIYECKKMGITVLPPDINLSGTKYLKEKNGIRYPLNSIKNLGINASSTIMEARSSGPFANIFDFVKRCYGNAVNKKTLESLIYAGVFDSFNINRATLINNLDAIIGYGELIKDLDEEFALKPEIISYPEYDSKFIMAKELELFGLYLSRHPVTDLRVKYPNSVPLSEVNQHFDKFINIIAYVDQIREITTKKGDKMAFIVGSDELATLDITLFPKIYKDNIRIQKGDVIAVYGHIEKRYDKYQIIASKIAKLKTD